MSEHDAVLTQCIMTKERIVESLKHLGVQAGDCLLVHSALSSLGWVCGREISVVEALREVVGESGTLVMPAFTGDNSEPSYWQNPSVPDDWYEIIREHMPPFDPQVTPVRQMGKIVEAMMSYPETLRSSHPQDSFIALGKEAKDILKNQPLDISLGLGSPLDHLYHKDAKILLLGVDFDHCTAIHLSETKLSKVNCIFQGSRMIVDGRSQWVTFKEVEYDDHDFIALGRDYEQTGRVHIGKVGMATCRYMSLKDLCDYALPWLEKHR